GANIRNILEFEKNFPSARVYKLEQNYRSTQQILDAANRLIRHNRDRKSKELFSDNKQGAKVEYVYATSDYNEADVVLSTIANLKRYNAYTNGDFAILVRNNSLTRLFERSLSSARIPYRVFGGFKFFDRKEILDVVAYMRLIVNPKDSEALTRIINFPKRGIGDTTIATLEQYATDSGRHLNDVIEDIDNVDCLSNAVKNKISNFNMLINELSLECVNAPLKDFADYLVKRVGFKEAYLSTGKEEDETRWENIDEFLRYIEETTEQNEDMKLSEFLQSLALSNERDSDVDDEECVTIATMHSAKGLEFNVVFIVACEEGIIPSSMSLRDNGVEEERRVMYVAMTRARERLYVSCVKGYRNKFGRQESTLPSRFISEAKGEEYKRNDGNDFFNRYFDGGNADYADAIPKASAMRSLPAYTSNTVVEQPKKVYNESTDGFVSGAKVKHKRYGIGTIIIKEGSGAGTTVTVLFKDLGMKKFSLMNAPLELV
ncbi:MAG: ATP-dependent helicase, partial [Christensenellales bacterium]